MKGTGSKLDYVFTGAFDIEPRFYYNRKKRAEKGKKMINNSGNYLALDFLVVPDLFTASNRNGAKANKAFSLIPKWGMRRSISKVINFQFAAGVGYQWAENNIHGVTIGLNLILEFRVL